LEESTNKKHMPKHLARWLIILGIVIVAYYIYKNIMAVFTAAANSVIAPITDAEDIVKGVGTGISNGVSAIYNDIKNAASSIVGVTTAGTTDNATNANLIPPIAPGLSVLPTPIGTHDGQNPDNMPVQFNFAN
jgi:hypothetical protein